jgi:hypothetical protein
LKPASAFSALLMAVALGGCATYGDWVGHMEGDIARQDPKGALRVLDDRSGMRDKDAALYQLNRGMLLRMQGDYAASNAAFEAAKTAIDRFLAISVTEQAESLTVNDAERAYTGEPFERAYIHVFEALNYLDMGRPDQARVEMLQLDVLLGGFEKKKEFFGTAFPRYLSGMIFESLGEIGDAMIAYREAYEAYKRYPAQFDVTPPRDLVRDLVRLGRRLGLDDEADRYRKEYHITDGELVPRTGQAQVVLLLSSGLVPVKQESNVVAPTTTGRFVSVSMPYYVSRPSATTGATLSADGATAHTALAENLDAVAIATLEQERPAILARTVARAVVKNDVSRRVSKDNELLGVVVNLAGVITERADTRSWSTLPNRIYVARLALDPGRHVVRVKFEGGHGETARDFPVDLAPGDLRLIALYRITEQDLLVTPGRRRVR